MAKDCSNRLQETIHFIYTVYWPRFPFIMISLLCLSPKGTEKIAQITIESSLDTSKLNETTSLTITDYTKDKELLNNKNLNLKLLPQTGAGISSLIKFNSYLYDRQKAGIINITDYGTIYVLPPSDKDQAYLNGYLKVTPTMPPAEASSSSGAISTQQHTNDSAHMNVNKAHTSNSAASSLLSRVSILYACVCVLARYCLHHTKS